MSREPADIHDIAEWCRARAREGAKAVHASATTPTKQTQLTDAESAAKARARIEKGKP